MSQSTAASALELSLEGALSGIGPRPDRRLPGLLELGTRIAISLQAIAQSQLPNVCPTFSPHRDMSELPMDCSAIQFQYADQVSAAELDQLVALFQDAAFWAKDRTREQMATAITHSYPIVTAWDGPRLIGFARATSDGVFRATIWDVVISPDYQGGGLGRKLVETLVAHPHMSRVERVYLMTTHQQGFYARIGFAENPSTTMVLYNTAEIEMLPSLGQPAERPIAAEALG